MFERYKDIDDELTNKPKPAPPVVRFSPRALATIHGRPLPSTAEPAARRRTATPPDSTPTKTPS